MHATPTAELEYSVLRKKKKTSSAIFRNNHLYIYLSHRTSEKESHALITHFLAWGNKEKHKRVHQGKWSKEELFFHHEQCPTFTGKTYPIQWKWTTRRTPTILGTEEYLIGYVPIHWALQEESYTPTPPVADFQHPHRILLSEALLKYLGIQYQDVLYQRLTALQKEYFPEYPFRTLVLKSHKSRWGSCSRDGEITLSRTLLLLPPQYMEYVMVHELAHLIHMSHSSAFWKEVARVCPDYRKKRRELNSFGI